MIKPRPRFSILVLLLILCVDFSTAAEKRIVPPLDRPFTFIKKQNTESIDVKFSETAGSSVAGVITQASSNRELTNIVGGVWSSQGPGPSQNGGVDGISNGETSGAGHTIIAHPSDANIAWVGATNGGVWKTINARASSPTWVAQTDSQVSLSIGAMDLDLTDTTSQTLVAGIGRYSSFGGAGGPLKGMLRTVDGGSTWTSLTSAVLENQSSSGVAARGSTLLFSASDIDQLEGQGGLFRSTDAGASWIKIDGADGTGLPGGVMFDMVGDPNSLNRFYLTVKGAGIYRSDDAGENWVLISNAAQVVVFADTDLDADGFSFSANNNAEMAVAPNGRLYVAIINQGQAVSIEYTDNPAALSPTWVLMDLPSTPTATDLIVTGATNASPIVITTSVVHGLSSGNFVQVRDVGGNTAANGIFGITVMDTTTFSLRLTTGNGAYTSGGAATRVFGLNPRDKRGSQGQIHFSIAADNTDSNIVYVGGDSQQLDVTPNFVGASNFTGRLWRGTTTQAPSGESPSPQWAHLTHSNSIAAIPTGGTANDSAPHADSREMVLDVNGEILQVDDGGIYRRTSPKSNTGDWLSMNGDIRINEQHDIAYDTISNIIISGTQDNGTVQQVATSSVTWDEIGGGDGGDVSVDTTTAAPNSIRYFSSQNNGGFTRQQYDVNNNFISENFAELVGSGSWTPNFVTPTELNTVDQSRLVLGGENGILESLDKGDTVSYLVTEFINEGGLAYGANGKPEVLYAASDASVLVRLSGNAAPVVTATAFPGGTISDIAINPFDENTLYVIDSTNAFVTTDAGASWSDISGNLDGASLRTIEFISGVNNSIAVGGQGGVYRMDITQLGVWSNLGSGLPNVIYYDLDFDSTDNILVAASLGRGAWLLTNANSTTATSGDGDGDGISDANDNCPINANVNQLNTDGDTLGNICDDDDDGDGVNDTSDAFPLDAAETLDTDLDGTGNNADTDDDNDGILDAADAFPLDATNTPEVVTRLQNLATRGFVSTGDRVMIGGLVIRGTQAKTVVIRARGPALTTAGVSGALTNPNLILLSGSTVIDSNDDWQDTAGVTLIPETLKPVDDTESVIAISLNPGAYTAIMSGVGGEEGIGLIEVFEVEDTGQTRLQNIATRAFIGTGDSVMIGGIVISGNQTKKLLIRAKGPSLADAGVADVISDPRLTLLSGASVVKSNDDWQDDDRSGEIPDAFKLANDLEAAILIDLAPGAYTAIVDGFEEGTGVGLVEVFEID
jgi:hypothetical protein